jgi:hypothetical protein
MKEIKCIPINYNKTIMRVLIDFVAIFLLLYIITFIEYIMDDFSNSFALVLNAKLPIFFIIMGISLALSILLTFMDIGSRSAGIKYDDEKIIFIRKNNEISVNFGRSLAVRYENRDEGVIFNFREGKRTITALINKGDAKTLIEDLKGRGVSVVANGQKSNKAFMEIIPNEKNVKNTETNNSVENEDK